MYVDNAREFKSEALTRGCQQHGIDLDYRPLGQPQYGGIIERVIGTAMQEIHELPGTTFSNPVQRGSYDSEKKASLTMTELENGWSWRWRPITARCIALWARPRPAGGRTGWGKLGDLR